MQINQEWVHEPAPINSPHTPLRTPQTYSWLHPDTHELYNETTIHTVLKLKTSRMRDIQKWSPVLAGHLYTPAQSRSDTKQIKRGAKLTRRSVLANTNVSELPTQTHKSHRDFPHHVHNLVMQELLNNIPRTQRSNNECSTKMCYWKHAGISISKRSSNGKPIHSKWLGWKYGSTFQIK